jgi:hypothetical protein
MLINSSSGSQYQQLNHSHVDHQITRPVDHNIVDVQTIHHRGNIPSPTQARLPSPSRHRAMITRSALRQGHLNLDHEQLHHIEQSPASTPANRPSNTIKVKQGGHHASSTLADDDLKLQGVHSARSQQTPWMPLDMALIRHRTTTTTSVSAKFNEFIHTRLGIYYLLQSKQYN